MSAVTLAKFDDIAVLEFDFPSLVDSYVVDFAAVERFKVS